MIPTWLHVASWVSLIVAALCALIIAVDETRRPQPMWIMNLVWPITALFGSVIWLAFYWHFGRSPQTHNPASRSHPQSAPPPRWTIAAKAASHCGAGCTLGDIIAEIIVIGFPGIAVALGWHSLFQVRMFAVWVLDFILAYGFGIVFQYFTITPMRGLGLAAGLWAAVKADTLSLIAWQVGMYGTMAVAQFGLFQHLLHSTLTADQPEFWLVMQFAMVIGFAVAYPVNAWLIRAGLKEKM